MVLLIATAGVATVVVRPTRSAVLRAVGWALVVDETVGPADIIVVTADAGPAGVLDAADLVRGGIATRVAVFSNAPETVDREFIRRGAPYEGAAARSIRQLRSLGVTAAEQIPRAAAGTEDEGRNLRDWCDEQRFGSVVVITSPDHSRRIRRVLRRSMQGHRTRVAVRFARYSSFDPNWWWQSRSGIRTEIIEIQKLLLDFARHPIS